MAPDNMNTDENKILPNEGDAASKDVADKSKQTPILPDSGANGNNKGDQSKTADISVKEIPASPDVQPIPENQDMEETEEPKPVPEQGEGKNPTSADGGPIAGATNSDKFLSEVKGDDQEEMLAPSTDVTTWVNGKKVTLNNNDVAEILDCNPEELDDVFQKYGTDLDPNKPNSRTQGQADMQEGEISLILNGKQITLNNRQIEKRKSILERERSEVDADDDVEDVRNKTLQPQIRMMDGRPMHIHEGYPDGAKFGGDIPPQYHDASLVHFTRGYTTKLHSEAGLGRDGYGGTDEDREKYAQYKDKYSTAGMDGREARVTRAVQFMDAFVAFNPDAKLSEGFNYFNKILNHVLNGDVSGVLCDSVSAAMSSLDTYKGLMDAIYTQNEEKIDRGWIEDWKSLREVDRQSKTKLVNQGYTDACDAYQSILANLDPSYKSTGSFVLASRTNPLKAAADSKQALKDLSNMISQYQATLDMDNSSLNPMDADERVKLQITMETLEEFKNNILKSNKEMNKFDREKIREDDINRQELKTLTKEAKQNRARANIEEYKKESMLNHLRETTHTKPEKELNMDAYGLPDHNTFHGYGGYLVGREEVATREKEVKDECTKKGVSELPISHPAMQALGKAKNFTNAMYLRELLKQIGEDKTLSEESKKGMKEQIKNEIAARPWRGVLSEEDIKPDIHTRPRKDVMNSLYRTYADELTQLSTDWGIKPDRMRVGVTGGIQFDSEGDRRTAYNKLMSQLVDLQKKYHMGGETNTLDDDYTKDPKVIEINNTLAGIQRQSDWDQLQMMFDKYRSLHSARKDGLPLTPSAQTKLIQKLAKMQSWISQNTIQSDSYSWSNIRIGVSQYDPYNLHRDLAGEMRKVFNFAKELNQPDAHTEYELRMISCGSQSASPGKVKFNRPLHALTYIMNYKTHAEEAEKRLANGSWELDNGAKLSTAEMCNSMGYIFHPFNITSEFDKNIMEIATYNDAVEMHNKAIINSILNGSKGYVKLLGTLQKDVRDSILSRLNSSVNTKEYVLGANGKKYFTTRIQSAADFEPNTLLSDALHDLELQHKISIGQLKQVWNKAFGETYAPEETSQTSNPTGTTLSTETPVPTSADTGTNTTPTTKSALHSHENPFNYGLDVVFTPKQSEELVKTLLKTLRFPNRRYDWRTPKYRDKAGAMYNVISSALDDRIRRMSEEDKAMYDNLTKTEYMPKSVHVSEIPRYVRDAIRLNELLNRVDYDSEGGRERTKYTPRRENYAYKDELPYNLMSIFRDNSMQYEDILNDLKSSTDPKRYWIVYGALEKLFGKNDRDLKNEYWFGPQKFTLDSLDPFGKYVESRTRYNQGDRDFGEWDKYSDFPGELQYNSEDTTEMKERKKRERRKYYEKWVAPLQSKAKVVDGVLTTRGGNTNASIEHRALNMLRNAGKYYNVIQGIWVPPDTHRWYEEMTNPSNYSTKFKYNIKQRIINEFNTTFNSDLTDIERESAKRDEIENIAARRLISIYGYPELTAKEYAKELTNQWYDAKEEELVSKRKKKVDTEKVKTELVDSEKKQNTKQKKSTGSENKSGRKEQNKVSTKGAKTSENKKTKEKTVKEEKQLPLQERLHANFQPTRPTNDGREKKIKTPIDEGAKLGSQTSKDKGVGCNNPTEKTP